ncbi:hypothetical protein [Bacillus sp. BP-3]|uniref:hypothetical protein n=1 Tax=Bacillus sp. BP-3 TaxID=3022773 RepID=UPI00232F9D2F|nr:hypothetical protein [Bacillus sp. BP-3]MDC2866851.1 hypothetical protein [Bacillus sp. BP-3]
MKTIQIPFKVQECCGTENKSLQNNIDMQRLMRLPIAIIGEALWDWRQQHT